MEPELFVHVLLFQCPSCGGPIATALARPHTNLEQVDSCQFELRCDCGWKGNGIGVTARRHLVEAWEDSSAASRMLFSDHERWSAHGGICDGTIRTTQSVKSPVQPASYGRHL